MLHPDVAAGPDWQQGRDDRRVGRERVRRQAARKLGLHVLPLRSGEKPPIDARRPWVTHAAVPACGVDHGADRRRPIHREDQRDGGHGRSGCDIHAGRSSPVGLTGWDTGLTAWVARDPVRGDGVSLRAQDADSRPVESGQAGTKRRRPARLPQTDSVTIQ